MKLDQYAKGTPIEDDDDSNEEESDEEFVDLGYQNQQYWALPENVRHAIDLHKKKSKRTDFCNQLDILNEKINLYKILLYHRTPRYE